MEITAGGGRLTYGSLLTDKFLFSKNLKTIRTAGSFHPAVFLSGSKDRGKLLRSFFLAFDLFLDDDRKK
jgi:hypothetical protein